MGPPAGQGFAPGLFEEQRICTGDGADPHDPQALGWNDHLEAGKARAGGMDSRHPESDSGLPGSRPGARIACRGIPTPDTPYA